MKNKTIQEGRMREYFLTAAKELIRSEGIRVVSARNVADRAGYSYATLYNYFKDIRDLIFSCVEDFMAECKAFIEQQTKSDLEPRQKFLSITENYVKFFIQYPGIFELLYLQKLSDMTTKNSNVQKIDHFFDSLTEDTWSMMKNENTIIHNLKSRELHKYALHGLLMFYLNRRKQMEYKEFMNKIKAITDDYI